ncbi:MAG TPA: phosphatidylglycerophosphatase A [Polyangiaceae bacterium]|nr:phosphatidylglycerophosphatase A [Polyangiaceae bacterium]
MPQQDRTSRLIATWFGCGNAPIAPGTVGCLGTLPLHFALKAMGPHVYFVAAVASVAAGVWAAQRSAVALGEKDPQSVVIDEVAGTLISMGLCQGRSLKTQFLALALFRVLDIVKPGIIDTAQRLKPQGVGIMADDVLAGIVAGVLARLVSR